MSSKQKDTEIAVHLLSSLIATGSEDIVRVHRSNLQVNGGPLTEGWLVNDLKGLARAVTAKFRAGRQYDFMVVYMPSEQIFAAYSSRARQELVSRLSSR